MNKELQEIKERFETDLKYKLSNMRKDTFELLKSITITFAEARRIEFNVYEVYKGKVSLGIKMPLESYFDKLNSIISKRLKNKVPKNLSEAHDFLEHNILSKGDLNYIDNKVLKKEDMIIYHDSLGRYLRNTWGLWSKSYFYKYMLKFGYTHPDEMSHYILETFWNKRHKIQEFNNENKS